MRSSKMFCRSYASVFCFLFPKTRRKVTILIMICVLGVMFLLANHFSQSLIKTEKSTRTGDVYKDSYKSESIISTNHLEMNKVRQQCVEKIEQQVQRTETLILPSVLVITDLPSKHSSMKKIFHAMKINFDFITWNRLEDPFLVFPRLQDKYGSSRYHLIIFTNHYIYESIDIYSKSIVRKHCIKFNIGIIILTDLTHVRGESQFLSFSTLPILIQSGVMSLKDLQVAKSSLLKVTKTGKVLKGVVNGKRHAIFYSNHSSFEPIAYVTKSSKRKSDNLDLDNSEIAYNFHKKSISIIYDKGSYDGLRKVIFGSPITNCWLYQLIFVDVMSALSNGILSFNLSRYIQIDIDDIFVGYTGKKLIPSDVKALLDAQHYFASIIPGFKYNLGYSGKSFRNSNDSSERNGDQALIDHAKHFNWFCHTYSHAKPHKLSKIELVKELEDNKRFAKEYGIVVDNTYSVAPHHSGVYPTHEPLYEAWKEVLGVKVTSTEEYPHLYPAYSRKGFLHNDIQVLPRQTCGLFTTTLHNAIHPKGPTYLANIAYGGELFWSIIFNPIAIFMTHAGNYGFKERLAIDLFKNVTSFINKWTNIQLLSAKPTEIAKKYFELFPKQSDPVWTDPCTDKRHQKIWNHTEKYCKDNERPHIQRLPDVLILGPQKSGTTALYSFLSMHPNIKRSYKSNHSFEEVQFFNRHGYMKGLVWYLNFFPEGSKPPNTLYFEKSANYFDSTKSPLRTYSLVPNAKLIVILIDPKFRAYSWYQHMRFKNTSMATMHTFYEVLTGQNRSTDYRFTVLQDRTLQPGLYAEALERWLQYYDFTQIHLIDGQELRQKPHLTMKKLIDFLAIPRFAFEKRIKYDHSKGFYCSTGFTGNHLCLGKGKGRKYDPMTESEMQFLARYYRVPNLRLADLLSKYNKPLPMWLKKEIKDKEPD